MIDSTNINFYLYHTKYTVYNLIFNLTMVCHVLGHIVRLVNMDKTYLSAWLELHPQKRTVSPSTVCVTNNIFHISIILYFIELSLIIKKENLSRILTEEKNLFFLIYDYIFVLIKLEAKKYNREYQLEFTIDWFRDILNKQSQKIYKNNLRDNFI